jgi:hypothetical protein
MGRQGKHPLLSTEVESALERHERERERNAQRAPRFCQSGSMSSLRSITLPGGIYLLSYNLQNLIGAADVLAAYSEKFE